MLGIGGVQRSSSGGLPGGNAQERAKRAFWRTRWSPSLDTRSMSTGRQPSSSCHAWTSGQFCAQAPSVASAFARTAGDACEARSRTTAMPPILYRSARDTRHEGAHKASEHSECEVRRRWGGGGGQTLGPVEVLAPVVHLLQCGHLGLHHLGRLGLLEASLPDLEGGHCRFHLFQWVFDRLLERALEKSAILRPAFVGRDGKPAIPKVRTSSDISVKGDGPVPSPCCCSDQRKMPR